MRDNYENCLAITLKWEGGDVNHPDDPGGKTRWGITQATYDAWRKSQKMTPRSVFQMTKPEMLAIYRKNYWDAVKGDTLAYGVDLATWDFGVNSGPARARKYLLQVVGGPDEETVKRLCAKRLSFVRGLTTWKTFGKGWSNRIADIEARGVKMALSAKPGSAKSVEAALKAEASKAQSAEAVQKDTALASGAAGAISGGSVAVDPSTADQWASLALLGVAALAVGVMVYLAVKSRHNKARAEAYKRVAAEK